MRPEFSAGCVFNSSGGKQIGGFSFEITGAIARGGNNHLHSAYADMRIFDDASYQAFEASQRHRVHNHRHTAGTVLL